ncbi:MAG TPA: 16S rRNA (cytosine(1402)-N(4))-methyltransferase, partial [Clostridiales bacterium]|nr:16S rRNA (cytosine(1402)-N(4))-methyltransferase [Clostridiales bacterium]
MEIPVKQEEPGFSHIPVMPRECLEGLAVKPDGTYVDCTLGGAGHSLLIAERLGAGGTLIGLDKDPAAIEASGPRLQKRCRERGIRLIIRHSGFDRIKEVCQSLGILRADGILMDLGVSSHQLDEASRGFSYMADAPLDMRMDPGSSPDAREIINSWPREALEKIIREYGEERFSGRIAAAIVDRRGKAAIRTTLELEGIIREAIPAPARRSGPHPAKRTFQALRIAVNDELGALQRTIGPCIELLNPNGRLAIMTFHSLEDRIVKRSFEKALNLCTCPRQFPVCMCGGGKPDIEIITR